MNLANWSRPIAPVLRYLLNLALCIGTAIVASVGIGLVVGGLFWLVTTLAGAVFAH